MKKKLIFPLIACMAIGLVSCFKDMETVYDGLTLVEFNEAVIRTPAAGRTYSITSIPNSTTAGNSTVASVNLVGPQRTSDLTVKVLVDPIATTAGATNYTLVNGGNVVIPANSSVGSLTMVVGRATSTTAPLANVVLVLDSTSTDFKASQNYKRLGYSLRQ